MVFQQHTVTVSGCQQAPVFSPNQTDTVSGNRRGVLGSLKQLKQYGSTVVHNYMVELEGFSGVKCSKTNQPERTNILNKLSFGLD